MVIEEVDRSQEPVLELLLGRDSNVAKDRAGELGEEALYEVEPRAMRGRESEFEPASRLLGDPSLCLLGDMSGMIVEDQMDRRVGRVGGFENSEVFNDFAAPVAILHQSVNLTGQQVDSGQQAYRPVAFVLMITREGRVNVRLGRQVGEEVAPVL
jgi:hypothetical protein